ncbi:hypothetical protein COT63_00955 [Candidatus Shapirobacteria bacterium CG09_land_8_20_14_0_10_38_17]|uniref:Nucleotidyl transferase AbiEii/AbiGii toxin family protein n=1 Tax=Candidatus Shapirobacteria bacterium CG09_land_8_20_14_0_10_38_17 TaxID=1974884 RepID=A0A2H0WTL6_9BACT|nr:MAG: hypothetical protein COT63_00955 [Candidatus Shapirobacteria bacterium CG09_land_8_20_14_0_10_38_17]
MTKSIFSPHQREFIAAFTKSKLANSFYLTGGTALTGFYIPYRYSEDLDFFSEKEFNLMEITVFLKAIKNKLGYQKMDINTSFNRNIFQLFINKDILKTEFTYFPFSQLKKPKLKKGIKVDSILDIAVNKIFTIYQKPRSRDFIDLYMIHQNFEFEIDDLTKKAQIKFDWYIDPIKLGSEFLSAKKLKDYPRLIEKIHPIKWQNFFEKEAKKLKTRIFK